MKICPHCLNDFPQKRKNQKWCSRECGKSFSIQKRMSKIYSDKDSNSYKDFLEIRNRATKKYLDNPLRRLKHKMSNLIRGAIKRNGFTKKSRTYEILCCTFEDFKIHIEKQFKEGMSWENHGEWEFDHIIPISSARNEEESIWLNHYTNFQPLWRLENIKKSNKI